MSAANQPYERRLAAILAADLVGYSRLMAEDEEATLAAFNACRAVLADRIAGHHGRIFGGAGDSVIAEFASPVEAVRAAVEIQRELERRAAELADERRMRFRIGVNLGDVMAEGDNLQGDGVNLAARLEGLAEPGGICISAKVYDEVRNKLRLGFQDLGEQRVKNLPEPVRAYRVLIDPAAAGQVARRPKAARGIWAAAAATAVALIVAAGFLGWFQPWTSPGHVASVEREPLPLPSKPSIAVLPFANLNDEPEQELFIDGLTNDIITDLSKFSTLFVIAANSTFRYKGQAVDVEEVGRDLGVRYVLEGSVQRAGATLRVNAQLIDAPSGQHVWAERYDRPAKDFFAIQNEITRNVVGVISPLAEGRGKLQKEELERIGQTPTQNLDAYDYFLEAMFHMDHYTKEENRRARELFEKAIELDPGYARAYGKNTWTYLLEYANGWTDVPERALQKAMEVANAGLAADPNEPWVYYALGSSYIWQKEHDRGIQAYQRASELNPNDATILVDYGWALTWAGRPDEAIHLIERGMRLNPYHPDWYWNVLWRAHFVAGRYEEALDALLKIPNPYPQIYQNLAATYPYLNRVEEARATMAKFRQLEPQASVELYSRTTPFKRREDLQRYLDGLRKAGLPEKAPAPGT